MTGERPGEPRATLSDSEVERYSRQLLLPGWPESVQLQLRDSTAVIIGCGGLGGPAALYLAGAGVGRLRLVDPDRVGLENLHRQVAFSTATIGDRKVTALGAALSGLNPGVVVEERPERAEPASLRRLLEHADLVLECSDDPTTKFLVNDWCSIGRSPLVIGGALGFAGQVVVVGRGTPCYRCLYGPPPLTAAGSCREAGVAGPLVGIVGALQALEAIKLLANLGHPGRGGRLLDFDGLTGRWREIHFERNPACPAHRS